MSCIDFIWRATSLCLSFTKSLLSSIQSNQKTFFNTSSLSAGCISKIFLESWSKNIVLSKTSCGGKIESRCCWRSVSFLKTTSSSIHSWAFKTFSISNHGFNGLVYSIFLKNSSSVNKQAYKWDIVESFAFHFLRFLTTKYSSQFNENNSLINQVSDCIFRRFLVQNLYNAYVGPSKNRKDFPVQIGAFIK